MAAGVGNHQRPVVGWGFACKVALLLLEGLKLAHPMTILLPWLRLPLCVEIELEILLGVAMAGWGGQHEQALGPEDAGDGDNRDDNHAAAPYEHIAGIDLVRDGGAPAGVVPRMQLVSVGNEDTGSVVGVVGDVEAEPFAALLLGCTVRPPTQHCLVVGLDRLSHDSTPELASRLLRSVYLSRVVGTSSVSLSTNGS